MSAAVAEAEQLNTDSLLIYAYLWRMQLVCSISLSEATKGDIRL